MTNPSKDDPSPDDPSPEKQSNASAAEKRPIDAPVIMNFDHISTVMAFDFGQRRIGIAVGNTHIESSNPLVTIHNSEQEPDWVAISKQVREWQPDLIIVGLPTMLDGSASANTTNAEAFALQCQTRFSKPVILVDEKLSSAEAKEQLKASRQAGLRGRTKPGDMDKFAAQVILRTWMNERHGRTLNHP